MKRIIKPTSLSLYFTVTETRSIGLLHIQAQLKKVDYRKRIDTVSLSVSEKEALKKDQPNFDPSEQVCNFR